MRSFGVRESIHLMSVRSTPSSPCAGRCLGDDSFWCGRSLLVIVNTRSFSKLTAPPFSLVEPGKMPVMAKFDHSFLAVER